MLSLLHFVQLLEMGILEFLKGKFVSKNHNDIIIENGGFGMKVKVSDFALRELPSVGEDIEILLETIIKENDIELYGFKDKIEREIFRILQSVQGVGPQLALSIISNMTPSEFVFAVENKKLDIFNSIKGLGKKKAERITIELRGKLPEIEYTESGFSDIGGDALRALVSLGFNKILAKEIISSILIERPNIKLEELIKKALELS